jgi:hypothetical protein
MRLTLKQAIKELKSVQYIGEDGDMAIICKDEFIACRKFKKKWSEDSGEDELEIEPRDITIGFLHLATDEDRERFSDDEVEWYIDYSKESPNPVFAIRL